MYTGEQRKTPVTVRTLRKLKKQGEKITMMTAYDASFGQLLETAGIELVLVGDSLGMVVQGHDTTLPVTLEDMIYHTGMVARGCRNAMVIADMPFMTYQNTDRALENCAQIMQQGHARMVKLEGDDQMAETVRQLSREGIPVCAHLGLLPQNINKLGRYGVQGKDEQTALKILDDALILEQAGADLILVECIPSELGRKLSNQLMIPVIGIGAGPHCDGQVLVIYDILAVTPGPRPRFSKDFLAEAGSIHGAVQGYVEQVKAGTFPGPEHCPA